jgi:hypothetical protein
MKDKKSYIFIVQSDEGELMAGRQSDVDDALKQAETQNEDIEFKVIGKIAEPFGKNSLPLDFDESRIEWYEEGEKDESFLKRAVVAITNLITFKV